MNLNPAKTEFDEAEHKELRRQLEAVKSAEGLAQAEIARQMGLSSSMLSMYLRGSYDGDINTIAAKVQPWLNSRQRAAEFRMRMPVSPSFQGLPTSKKLLGLMDMAREMSRMVVIAGDPGNSKTATARQYCVDTPRSWLITMTPASSGVQTMLLEILSTMGAPDHAASPLALSKRVQDKLFEAQSALLIDEAQHCSDKSIEQLRAINDKARELGKKVGIVLIGNDTMNNRVGVTGNKAAFAQISSRIAMRRHLKRPERSDVAALAQAWAEANNEILTKAEIDFLQLVAARDGGLRNVEMTFEAALLVSLASNEPLTVDHLQGAFAQLSGLNLAA